MTFPVLSSLILCPTIALGLLLITPAANKNLIRGISLATAVICLILTGIVLMRFDASQAGFQLAETLPWAPAIGINYSLGVDGLSVTMVLLTSIVLFCGVLCSWHIQFRTKSFFANLMFLVLGVYGVFVSTNLFFFFLFYEIAVLPMYLFILIWGSTNREYAAMKLTLYLLFGSALIITGFLALYALGPQSFDLVTIKETLNINSQTAQILYWMFFLGFGSLAAVFPFHVWSPDGHVAAPTAASMMHAGVLMKLGSYGILRIGIFLFPEAAKDAAFYTALLALCNIVYGALVATQQRDIKYMIGFSSVSHMGIVILGISCMNQTAFNGAVFQMFSHGIMTALFFACVGFIYDQTHTRNLDELGGLSRKAPKICALFIIAGLVGLGLPAFSGFVAEFLVILGAVQAFPWIGIVSITGLLITAYYVLTALQKAFYGPLNPRWKDLKDVTAFEWFPRALLVAVLLYFGLFPGGFLELIHASTQQLAGMVS